MKKKKSGKKLKVLGIILSVILIIAIAFASMTAVAMKGNLKKANSFPEVGCNLKYENKGNGVWEIYADKELKVIQLTDVHLGGGWMSKSKDAMSINAVASMLKAEKPDFVIVTGDIAYPVPFQAGTFNNKNGARLFATLMEKLGIYWTVCYGNHDTEAYSYFSREDITKFYSGDEYPHCLLQSGPEDVDGSGNQIFKIVNSEGKITRALFAIDSHSYIDGDIFGIQWKYDNIHENQIEWYKNSITAMNKENADKGFNGVVPSNVFMHIPMTEYKDAWQEYVENGFKDTENVKHKYGTTGETDMGIFCGIHEDKFFEAMQELGSTDAVFCGHDHLNNFCLEYKGINLVYGMSIDYLAYFGISKLGTQRGCTVISIAPDGAINWVPENYYQDKYESFYEKEPVTMQDLLKEATAE